jgi:exopolyphosphatase/guanosine-5'-triphosphate,3'-diphosphate pyrophosphatase
LKTDPPTSAEVTACREAVRAALAGAQPALQTSDTLVAVGGTADTAARMLQSYGAGGTGVAEIQLQDLEDLARLTAALPLTERRRLKALPPERADIFPAGLIILTEIARKAERASLLITEADLLLGYTLRELMG